MNRVDALIEQLREDPSKEALPWHSGKVLLTALIALRDIDAEHGTSQASLALSIINRQLRMR